MSLSNNMPSAENAHLAVFDYRGLRFAMGCVALSLSFLVVWIAQEPLSSISVSYYTPARDVFVGSLFMVGTFLIAYNGHYLHEAILSKIAGLAALVIALEPTSCSITQAPVICANVTTSGHPTIHSIAALTHFSILAYFCLIPFRREPHASPAGKRRWVVYTLCGWAIIWAIVAVVLSEFGLIHVPRLVFYAETLALCSFGIAWILAGHKLPFFTHHSERWHWFKHRAQDEHSTPQP